MLPTKYRIHYYWAYTTLSGIVAIGAIVMGILTLAVPSFIPPTPQNSALGPILLSLGCFLIVSFAVGFVAYVMHCALGFKFQLPMIAITSLSSLLTASLSVFSKAPLYMWLNGLAVGQAPPPAGSFLWDLGAFLSQNWWLLPLFCTISCLLSILQFLNSWYFYKLLVDGGNKGGAERDGGDWEVNENENGQNDDDGCDHDQTSITFTTHRDGQFSPSCRSPTIARGGVVDEMVDDKGGIVSKRVGGTGVPILSATTPTSTPSKFPPSPASIKPQPRLQIRNVDSNDVMSQDLSSPTFSQINSPQNGHNLAQNGQNIRNCDDNQHSVNGQNSHNNPQDLNTSSSSPRYNQPSTSIIMNKALKRNGNGYNNDNNNSNNSTTPGNHSPTPTPTLTTFSTPIQSNPNSLQSISPISGLNGVDNNHPFSTASTTTPNNNNNLPLVSPSPPPHLYPNNLFSPTSLMNDFHGGYSPSYVGSLNSPPNSYDNTRHRNTTNYSELSDLPSPLTSVYEFKSRRNGRLVNVKGKAMEENNSRDDDSAQPYPQDLTTTTSTSNEVGIEIRLDGTSSGGEGSPVSQFRSTFNYVGNITIHVDTPHHQRTSSRLGCESVDGNEERGEGKRNGSMTCNDGNGHININGHNNHHGNENSPRYASIDNTKVDFQNTTSSLDGNSPRRHTRIDFDLLDFDTGSNQDQNDHFHINMEGMEIIAREEEWCREGGLGNDDLESQRHEQRQQQGQKGQDENFNPPPSLDDDIIDPSFQFTFHRNPIVTKPNGIETMPTTAKVSGIESTTTFETASTTTTTTTATTTATMKTAQQITPTMKTPQITKQTNYPPPTTVATQRNHLHSQVNVVATQNNYHSPNATTQNDNTNYPPPNAPLTPMLQTMYGTEFPSILPPHTSDDVIMELEQEQQNPFIQSTPKNQQQQPSSSFQPPPPQLSPLSSPTSTTTSNTTSLAPPPSFPHQQNAPFSPNNLLREIQRAEEEIQLENQPSKNHPVYIHVHSSPQSLSMSFGGIGYGTRRGFGFGRMGEDDGAVTGFRVMRPAGDGNDNGVADHFGEGGGGVGDRLKRVDESNQSTHQIDVGTNCSRNNHDNNVTNHNTTSTNNMTNINNNLTNNNNQNNENTNNNSSITQDHSNIDIKSL